RRRPARASRRRLRRARPRRPPARRCPARPRCRVRPLRRPPLRRPPRRRRWCRRAQPRRRSRAVAPTPVAAAASAVAVLTCRWSRAAPPWRSARPAWACSPTVATARRPPRRRPRLMARHRRQRAGRWALGTALAATVAGAGGAAVAAFGLLDGTPAHAGATYIPPSITTVAPRLASDPKARPLARSAPVKIRIPRIGVNAPVMKLGRDADGTVQVPPLAAHNLAGWYRYGPSPGQPGPAVIL